MMNIKIHDTMQISDLILLNNNQFIVFNKPPAIPLQQDKSADTSLHQLAEIYCKHPLKIVHRIDRPSSGLTVFAKNKKAAMDLSKQWKQRQIDKRYLAVVPRKRKLDHGVLNDLIWHHKKQNKSYIVEHKDDGAKEAIMEYNKIAEIDNYTLLEVKLITGRHHQIRSQLAHRDLPIKGDVKYGSRRGNRDRSIHLHAWKLQFKHPVSEEEIKLVAPVPEDSVWRAFQDKGPDLDLYLTQAYL